MKPKNDNVYWLRFIENLRKNTDENVSNDFAMRYPLSKSADIEKKIIWAMNVCEYLERNHTGDEIISIRKDCRRNDGKTIAEKM